MAEEGKIIANQWKHTLETTPTGPLNSLVSLYDLFYNEDGTLWVDLPNPETKIGCKLSHDIICFNRDAYKTSGEAELSQTATMQTSVWWRYGIDISLPLFDARSKFKVVNNNASIGDGDSEKDLFLNKEYRIYDKDSALSPKSIDDFSIRGILRSNGIEAVDKGNYNPPRVGVFSYTSSIQNTSDILLACSDTAMKSTLVSQDGMEAYNRIILNPYTLFGVSLVAKATGMDIDEMFSNGYDFFSGDGGLRNIQDFLGGDLKNFWVRGTQENPYYVAQAVDCRANPSNAEAIRDKENKQSEWFYLLKNTYVWVRSTFYADYIVPESFNQDLNQTAHVVHSELMLSGAGDFKKYDTYYYQPTNPLSSISSGNYNDFNNVAIGNDVDNIQTVEKSEDSEPYVPKTSPTVDIYTSALMDAKLQNSKDFNVDKSNYSTKLKSNSGTIGEELDTFLEDETTGNDAITRGLPVSPINRNEAQNALVGSKPDDLVPPNYFDPESRKNSQDYEEMGRLPTMLPKDGNLFVDGRIIGPTIDEIWIMLKKLTGGRLSDVIVDNESETNANSTRAVQLDIGIPYGSTANLQNDTDTTMTEVPDSQFNFKYLDSAELNKKGDPIDFTYTGGILDKKLEVTKFINQNDAIVYPVYQSLKDLSSDITTHDYSETKVRGISNFTAWNDIGKSETVVGDNETVVDGIWAPRKVPYSLRELEAIIMGNKFNIITQARFVKENFAITGGLGKVTGDTDSNDMSNLAAGSLYQLHRNYNFDVADPNTVYNYAGEPEQRATIDDVDLRTEEQKNNYELRYAETYGTSPYINYNQEKYSSSDVYLAASGDWRYVADHVRIPCLKDEF